jgi:hypothetical protein
MFALEHRSKNSVFKRKEGSEPRFVFTKAKTKVKPQCFIAFLLTFFATKNKLR